MGFRGCLPLVSLFFFTLVSSSVAVDTIDRTRSIRDGQILESSGGSFQLGFFTPPGSTGRYLGIWFNKDQAVQRTIVWVANREKPLNGSAGVLKLGAAGGKVLAVLDGAGDAVWSSNVGITGEIGSPVAQLLESGNLVVRDVGKRTTDGLLWQSFDEPGDTLLPGMKLRLNMKTGESRHLTSWNSPSDPSPGRYSYRLHGDKLPPAMVLVGPSAAVKFSTGPLIGNAFSGYTEMNANGIFNTTVSYEGDEVYYVDKMIRNSTLIRIFLSPSGVAETLLWSESTPVWKNLIYGPTDDCDRYGFCGPFASCRVGDFPPCRCLRGFHPRNPQDWFLGNGAAGCVRRTKLDCGAGDGFLRVRYVKLPDVSVNATVSLDMSLERCRDRCMMDCNCTAYASAGVGGEDRGCINWSGDLVDIRNFTSSQGQDLFLRVAASDLVKEPTPGEGESLRDKRRAILVPAMIISWIVPLAFCGSCVWRRSARMKTGDKGRKRKHGHEASLGKEDLELPLFDFQTISLATNDFSIRNKIGEGGFGVVYKGTLEDGLEVAVKRLSRASVQGSIEFMNEVMLIAKLQHKNLVRLLGCCIHGEERMLIYEYMQNKSLDSFIFDETKRALLGWKTRLDIISGIARGLMYLHHDSRYTIIHRDLKASNILLDGAMNPKISDFGTARIFKADQNVEKTKRVIGTHGYMSPEYVIKGIISVKSDVFSFGVLILEIMSGIRNRGIYVDSESHINLLAHAWKLWQEGNCMQLLDAAPTSPFPQTEMLRCIQVGLLCVQEHAVDRPAISEVVMMLSTETFPLPQPRRPGLLVLKSPGTTEVSSSFKQRPSSNRVTITDIVDGR